LTPLPNDNVWTVARAKKFNQVHNHYIPKMNVYLRTIICILVLAWPARAKVYDVGPGQPYETIGSVPWYALKPGDKVQIHFRTQPYREKFLISSRGMPDAHITLVGIPGPDGEQPVITGQDATTGRNMHYRWTTPGYQQALGVLQIGYRQDGPKPGFIDVSNLTVTGAMSSNTYTAQDGSKHAYAADACGVHIYGAEHVSFSQMTITGNANGFFAKSGGSEDAVSRDITVQYSSISQNGVAGSFLEHDLYTEADRVTVQGNRFGMLIKGALGSILKDRSAGSVIRYNWFPTAARMLDLVEPQDGCPLLCKLSYYGQDFVYGNVFYSNGADPFEMVHPIHYGGDSGMGSERRGPLYFYENTFVLQRNQQEGWKVGIFEVTGENATIDVRNNIFANFSRTTGSPPIEMDFSSGTGNFAFGPNWVSPGWHMAFTGWTPFAGTVSGTSNFISPSANDPGFVSTSAQDFHLREKSTALNLAASLNAAVYSNALSQNFDALLEYRDPARTEPRRSIRIDRDLGAFHGPQGIVHANQTTKSNGVSH
jgi:hypothetical protein